MSRGELTADEKARRVVLKRLNVDRTAVRKNFLGGGTIAKGAAESGAVEGYINGKISRSPYSDRSARYWVRR